MIALKMIGLTVGVVFIMSMPYIVWMLIDVFFKEQRLKKQALELFYASANSSEEVQTMLFNTAHSIEPKKPNIKQDLENVPDHLIELKKAYKTI